jgi:hypothetical protein
MATGPLQPPARLPHGLTDLNGLKQNPEFETFTLTVLSSALDRSHFRMALSIAVGSLEQDQNECQIECQNRAREGLSRAWECSCALVFVEVSAIFLR